MVWQGQIGMRPSPVVNLFLNSFVVGQSDFDQPSNGLRTIWNILLRAAPIVYGFELGFGEAYQKLVRELLRSTHGATPKRI